jgi:hypothetical protein
MHPRLVPVLGSDLGLRGLRSRLVHFGECPVQVPSLQALVSLLNTVLCITWSIKYFRDFLDSSTSLASFTPLTACPACLRFGATLTFDLELVKTVGIFAYFSWTYPFDSRCGQSTWTLLW